MSVVHDKRYITYWSRGGDKTRGCQRVLTNLWMGTRSMRHLNSLSLAKHVFFAIRVWSAY